MRSVPRIVAGVMVMASAAALGEGRAAAQVVVSYYQPPAVSYYQPPAVSYYQPPPVVSYYQPPAVSYYQPPAVSYYQPAQPVVSYYQPPVVSYYQPPAVVAPATSVTTYRYGLLPLPHRRVTVTTYGPTVVGP